MHSQARADRRRAYHRVLGILRQQTGDPQPVLCDANALWTHVRHSDVHVDAATRAFRAAREQGHVIRWRDADETWRYGLTADGLAEHPQYERFAFGAADRAGIEAVRDTEVQRDDVDKRVVAWCNRRLADLEEVADG